MVESNSESEPFSETEHGKFPIAVSQYVAVYEPNRQVRLGWRVWPEMFTELVRARELLWRLAWRDIRARTKQSVLGVGMSVLAPLVLAGVFTYLNRSGRLPIGESEFPYPLFVYLALLPWQLLAGGLSRATPSLVNAADLVGKIQFPRETLVLSALAQAVFDFLLSLPVLVGMLVYYGQPVAWSIVGVPILLALQLALMAGLGYLLALLHAASRDVGNGLPLLLIVWMFLTPVVYPAPYEAAAGPPKVDSPQSQRTLQPESADAATSKRDGAEERPATNLRSVPAGAGARAQRVLSVVNPMYPLVVGYRDLVLRGRLTMPGTLVWSAAVCIAVWLFGWRLFHLVEPKIAERV